MNLMHNICYPGTGLHSMSTTKWSICGAYDFTCSMCRTFVCQMWGVWSLSSITLIFDETPKDQSLHISFVEFGQVFADKSEHFKLLLEHVLAEFVGFLSETFIESIPFSVLFEHFTISDSSQLLLAFGVVFPVSTLSCMWRIPPEHPFKAAHAVSQPGSEDGISPRFTRSATSFGQSCRNKNNRIKISN